MAKQVAGQTRVSSEDRAAAAAKKFGFGSGTPKIEVEEVASTVEAPAPAQPKSDQGGTTQQSAPQRQKPTSARPSEVAQNIAVESTGRTIQARLPEGRGDDGRQQPQQKTAVPLNAARPGDLAPGINRQAEQNAASGYQDIASTDEAEAQMEVAPEPEQISTFEAETVSADKPTYKANAEVENRGKEQEATHAVKSMSRAFGTVGGERARNEMPLPSQQTKGVMRREKRDPQVQDLPSIRVKRAAKAIKDAAKSLVQGKFWNGDALYGKMQSDTEVKPNEVSVGTEEIEALIREPRNGFLAMVSEMSGIELDPATVSVVRDVMPIVNGMSIKVGTRKSPINRGSSAQKRTLRIHLGRGIRLHPTQSKAYNADFDGDDMTVVFDQSKLDKYEDAMKYLVDIDGAVTLDNDFFPTPLLDRSRETRDYLSEYALGWYPAGNSKSNVVDKVISLTEDPSDSKRWHEFAKSLYDASSMYGEKTYDVMSDLLDSVYKSLREVKQIRCEFIARESDNSTYQAPVKTSEQADLGVDEVLANMVSGKVPNNFQDFKIVMAKYIGEIEGRNVSFRLGADIAKMIKMDDKISVGKKFVTIEGEAGLYDLYQHTMTAGYSMLMSNAVTLGEKQTYIAEFARHSIIVETGFPERYNGDYTAFLDTFVRSYKNIENLINAADVQFLQDFSIPWSDKNLIRGLKSRNLSDVVEALSRVYGEFTMERMFSASSEFGFSDDMKKDLSTRYIRAKYRGVTLREFAQSNTVRFTQAEAEKIGRLDYRQARIDQILIALADRKNRRASKYNMTMVGKGDGKPVDGKDAPVFEKMLKTINSINDVVDNHETRDWKKWCTDLVELLYEAGPNMFSYYKMDSPAGFFNSKYGQALLAAKTADEVGGIRTAMLVEYRFAAANQAKNSFVETRSSVTAEIEDIAASCNKMTMELDELSSCSDVWYTIVREVRSDKSGRSFDMLKGTKGTEGFKGLNVSKAYYSKWSDMSHDSLLEFLMDTSVGYADKMAVLGDVTRLSTRNEYVLGFAMGYQLELEPNATFSSMGYTTETNVFDVLDTFNDSYKRYAKRSRKAAIKNVQEAFDRWGSTEGALDETLRILASDPSSLIEVNDQLYADALLVPMDKQFAQSEKAGQAPGANAIYQALMMQRNGGYYSDVYRTDNRALGLVQKDQLTISDLVSILADPKKSIMVYDETGAINAVSREILCGDTSEGSLWRYLIEHPSVAMAIRGHQVNTIAGSKGKCFVSARTSMGEIIAERGAMAGNASANRAKAMLRDHPRYGAMIAMMAPVTGNVSRNIRQSYISNEEEMLRVVTNLAARKKKDNAPSMLAYMEETMGLTAEKVISMGVDEIIANDLVTEISESLDRYSDDVMRIYENAGEKIPTRTLRGFASEPNISSIAMYYDVRQELSGAKTNVSTGIEGQETWNNATWMAILSPADRYADLGAYERDEVVQSLIGCMTSEGIVIDESNVDALLDAALEGDIVVEVPPGFQVADKMLDSYGNQVSSVSRYLIVKRDDGAEKFNLKAKKLGDDGTDSITKSGKYLDDDPSNTYVEVTQMVEQAYGDEGNEFEAKMALAKYLMKQNKASGYKDMDIANYMCIADLMIKFDAEQGIVIRSLEQIAYTIRHQVDLGIVEDGNVEDIARNVREIADQVGLSRMVDPSMVFDGLAVHGSSEFSPVLRQRSSAHLRNYNLVAKIANETGVRALGTEEIREAVAAATERNPAIARKFRESKGLMGYDFIGVVGNGAVENIGPRNAWVLDDPRQSLDRAEQLGITVFVPDSVAMSLPSDSRYFLNMIPSPVEGMHMIPFFDMRLNGMYTDGHVTGESASWQQFDDMDVVSYEDTTGEHALADASVQVFRSLADRTEVNYSDVYRVSDADLFADVYAEYSGPGHENVSFEVAIASADEVERFIIQNRETPAIDYGVSMSASSFEDRKERIDSLIQEFRGNYGNSENGVYMSEARPNQIVAWARCDIYEKGETVSHAFAPIIAWPTGSSLSAPSSYEIKGIDFDSKRGEFRFAWKWNGSLEHSYFKVHEGIGAANKMMGTGEFVEGGELKNGVALDMAYALPTTSSRRLGTNKRMQTLGTLFHMARRDPYGYNFADHPSAFPDDPELKERLSAERIPIEEWSAMLSSGPVRFSSDPKMSAFIARQVDACMQRNINPSDFLASEFGGVNQRWRFEYETIMDTTYSYQNNIMSFFNMMMPTLCGPNMEADYSNCLFRPSDGKGFDFGCMQMQVPHKSAVDGSTYYVWENVYVGPSFFGKDFSGFSKPNVNGASSAMDQINTMALQGKAPVGMDLRRQLQWALSDRARVDAPGSIELDIAKMMFKDKEEDDG